jgi:hypothetical protein
MNTKAIKTQATQVGLVTAGFMGANLVSKVAPIKNDKIKSIIPLALGLAAAMTSKNKNIQVVGAGAASFGLLKTVRTLLMGSDPIGTNGVEGIADNPAVKKVLNMLIPNLGEIEDFEYATGAYDTNYFEPAIVDVPFEEINGVEGMEENSLLGSIEQDSLVGFDYDYENEMYL